MKILKNKRMLIFFGVAILIAVILGWVIFSAINFMAGVINSTSGNSTANVSPIRFNFDKLKQIGIIKD